MDFLAKGFLVDPFGTRVEICAALSIIPKHLYKLTDMVGHDVFLSLAVRAQTTLTVGIV